MIKFPVKDDFAKRAGFWNIVSMTTRALICFAIVINEADKNMQFTESSTLTHFL